EAQRGGVEGARERPRERPAGQGEPRHGSAGAARRQGILAADGLRREVGRLAGALLLAQRLDDLALLVDVIAEGEQIDARLAQPAIEARRQAGAASGVLGVGDDTVEALALDQRWQ